ncbi:MAG TPA: MFS transporter, partial [Phycisphaerae bacterium]|nr:MFS transporter [Phycisphaerae bacterium]
NLDLLMIASGVLSAIMFAPNLTLCADLAPSDQRGAAFTGFNIAGSFGFIIGPLFAGAVYTWFVRHTPPLSAYQSTFILTGAAQVICGLITLPMLLRLKRRGLTY